MFAFILNRAFVLFIIALFTTPCFAEDNFLQHLVFNQPYPPGSIVIEYGGVESLIRKELTSRFHNLHREYLLTYFGNKPLVIRERMISMQWLQRDLNSGGAWFTRKWWHSFPETKGGAFNTPIRLFCGRQTDIFNLGFARITNNFKFKLKEIDVSISELVSDGTPSPHDWRLKVKPALRFSLKEIISRISLSVSFDYIYRFNRLLSFQVYASYHRKKNEGRAGINIFFLHW